MFFASFKTHIRRDYRRPHKIPHTPDRFATLEYGLIAIESRTEDLRSYLRLYPVVKERDKIDPPSPQLLRREGS